MAQKSSLKRGIMKIARFGYKGHKAYGVVEGEDIFEIEGSLFDTFSKTGIKHTIDSVKLLPPAEPTKIVCIGQNYLEHIKEIGATPPEKPHYFLKPPSSLIGPGDDIVYPKIAERVDYEGELAIVIKKHTKEILKKDALDCVLGYTCFNDVTERHLVGKSPFNLSMAKGFDTFSALGPYVVTNIDPDHLEIKTYLNDNLMQHDNTNNCVFKVETLLVYLSHCLTLCPGDVVTTGTPKGIAPMSPGDLVVVEIEGIGKLTNRVKAAD